MKHGQIYDMNICVFLSSVGESIYSKVYSGFSHVLSPAALPHERIKNCFILIYYLFRLRFKTVFSCLQNKKAVCKLRQNVEYFCSFFWGPALI